MKEIVEKYRQWKEDNPDVNNIDIYDFIDSLTGNEIKSIFEYLDDDLYDIEYQHKILDIC